MDLKAKIAEEEVKLAEAQRETEAKRAELTEYMARRRIIIDHGATRDILAAPAKVQHDNGKGILFVSMTRTRITTSSNFRVITHGYTLLGCHARSVQDSRVYFEYDSKVNTAAADRALLYIEQK